MQLKSISRFGFQKPIKSKTDLHAHAFTTTKETQQDSCYEERLIKVFMFQLLADLTMAYQYGGNCPFLWRIKA